MTEFYLESARYDYRRGGHQIVGAAMPRKHTLHKRSRQCHRFRVNIGDLQSH